MKKRLISLVLVFALVLSVGTIAVGAEEEYTKSQQVLNIVGEKAIQGLVKVIASFIPTPYSWKTEKKYRAENDFSVKKNEFITEADEGAKWYVGYGSRSLQTGNELECYVGGSLKVTKKLATEVRDDQRVRTVAFSDGRGINVFVGVDAFGLANSEVTKIRQKLDTYAKEHNIENINISSLHQHSCVDTYGMNGDILAAFFTGSIKNILGIPNKSGQNEEFMEHFYKAVEESIEESVENLEPGKLYYGSIDIADYIRDKRDPHVIDPNINRIRFIPDDPASKETWLINVAIHCVGLGAGGTIVSGDYPYYMEKYINENANANFMMIEGAELAISSEYNDDTLEIDEELAAKYDDEGYARMAAYGKKLAQFACSINNDKLIDPIYNQATMKYITPTDNAVLTLAAKVGLLTNTIVRSGIGKYSVVTEVGYAEFGKDIAIAIVPGELAPEIAYGGAMTAEESWLGTSWDYKPLKETVGKETLLVFGITNDQIGYMLTDNSWHSFLCENEEIVAASNVSGSTFVENFETLLDEVK